MGVKICPNCKSNNISFDPWMGQMWTCRKCNYRGPLVVDEEDADR